MAEQKDTGKSAAGRAKRQAILDHLHKVRKPLSSAQLSKAVGEPSQRSMIARLQRMHELGELAREDRIINKHAVYFYTPLVKETAFKLPPDSWDCARAETRLKKKSPVLRKIKSEGPWHTVHYGTDKDHPTPSVDAANPARPRQCIAMIGE